MADAAFSDGSWTLTAASGETVQARYIVNAAGIYSDIVAGKLGDFYTVRPRRGEYLLLDREQGSTVSHTIFQCPVGRRQGRPRHPDGGRQPPARPHSVYQDTGRTIRRRAEGLADVARLAAKSIPTVNTRAVITSFTGLRSARPEHDFVIAPSAHSPQAGWWNWVGIESPGLSSAPAIACEVASILRELGLPSPKTRPLTPTAPDSRSLGNCQPKSARP